MSAFQLTWASFHSLQHLHLLLFVAGRLAHLLLPLIIHHLLDHSPCLAIQIAQLAVLGRDLARIDRRRACNYMCPPLHLVDLFEVYAELFAGRGRLQRPCWLVEIDGMRQWPLALNQHLFCVRWGGWRPYLNDWLLSLDASFQAGLCDLHVKVLALEVGWHDGCDVHVCDCLYPFIWQLALLFLFLCLCLLVFCRTLFWCGWCWSVSHFGCISRKGQVDVLALAQVKLEIWTKTRSFIWHFFSPKLWNSRSTTDWCLNFIRHVGAVLATNRLNYELILLVWSTSVEENLTCFSVVFWQSIWPALSTLAHWPTLNGSLLTKLCRYILPLLILLRR